MRKKIGISLIVLISSLVTSLYLNSIEKGRIAGLQTDENIRGLILPHDRIAKELVLTSLEQIKASDPYKYIVILGPNHYFPENPTFITTTELEGFNLAHDHILSFLDFCSEAQDEPQLVKGEHSIMEYLPYISNHFPETKLIPLVISTNFSETELKNIAEYFAGHLPAETLFIVSVDFSHQTMLLEAMEKNEESIETITNFDHQTLLNFKDDHLDSPVAMAEFLYIMEDLETREFELWHNSHSSLLLDNPTLQGTSYIIGVFR